MKVTLEGHHLKVDVSDLISELDATEVRYVVDSLSCHEDVIKDVTDQILGGWTDGASRGWSHSGDAHPHCALDIARRRIAEGASDVARQEIKDLKKSLIYATGLYGAYSAWAWDQYHGRPGSHEVPKMDVDESLYEVVLKQRAD
jgi:hypothetical protein